MVLPPYFAFANLWIRLLAGIVAPVSVFALFLSVVVCRQRGGGPPKNAPDPVISSNATTVKDDDDSTTEDYCPASAISSNSSTSSSSSVGDENHLCKTTLLLSIVALTSSSVVMADALYAYEFGSSYGLCLFMTSLALVSWQAWNHGRARGPIQAQANAAKQEPLALLFLAVAFGVLVLSLQRTRPDDDFFDVRINPGLYYSPDNEYVRRIVDRWPLEKRSYESNHPTPWMYTGDARTGLPYFLNTLGLTHPPDWHRVYLRVPDDNEVLALDISFPSHGHNFSQPVYLVLHGVNGGSEEGYAQDLTPRRNAANSTVVVMVSRGLMDMPVVGWNFFHGARWSDAHAAASAVRKALAPDQILAGIGYSMGAIVLANYVSRSGGRCRLDAAFAISGALECRTEANYTRAQRLWQPMIADFMRTRQHLAKFAPRLRARMSAGDIQRLLRATHVVAVDEVMSVAYNGYRNLEHFYEDMGALGDVPLDVLQKSTMANDTSSLRKYNFAKISVPLCVLHSFDDPISTWRTNAGNVGLMHPSNLVRVGNGNVLLLLTKRGGHVGWPTGWFSHRQGWEFMNEAAASFVEAVDAVKKSRRRRRRRQLPTYLSFDRSKQNVNKLYS